MSGQPRQATVRWPCACGSGPSRCRNFMARVVRSESPAGQVRSVESGKLVR
jgi:hypothetical protein